MTYQEKNGLRSVTLTAIVNASEYIMTLMGETTTLEVKMFLRSQGYFATQKEVSVWMDELYRVRDWTYESNGIFRIYRFRDRLDYEFELLDVKAQAWN